MRKLLLPMLCMAFSIAAQAQLSCNASFSASYNATTSQVTLINNSTPVASTNLNTHYHVSWQNAAGFARISTAPQTHVYKTAGTYSIIVHQKVVDSNILPAAICHDTDTVTITVPAAPCAVKIKSIKQWNNTMIMTADAVNNTPNLTYTWNMGNGATVSGSPAVYNYPVGGFYMITLVATTGSCVDSASMYVGTFIAVPTSPCHTVPTATIIPNGSFDDNYSFVAHNPNAATNMTYSWTLGDGTTQTGATFTHKYAQAGTYNVKVVGTNGSCSDTGTAVVKVTKSAPAGIIRGTITEVDSLYPSDSLMVWLIKYDSSTTILSAIDSQIVARYPGTAGGFSFYSFTVSTQGNYRVKAARHNGPTSGTGMVPTYHDSSLMWNTAKLVLHAGFGNTTFANIYMRNGGLSAGPGFVGGNVNQGANKGTANGIPDMNVFLLDANGDAKAFTTTDANGYYSFSNIPAGAFSIVPENMNYATTPATFSIANGQITHNGVNFERSHKNKTIIPVPSGITNVNTQQLVFVAYPNPANDVVNINWGKYANETAQVTIADISGKAVYRTTANMNDNSTINVSNLQPGLYFLSVTSDAGSNTQKLIIK